MAQPEATPLEKQISKYNQYLRDLTILRDKVRDNIVNLTRLQPKQVQVFNEDRTPKMDKTKGTPIIESVLPEHMYEGRPMTQAEADKFCAKICSMADDVIKEIKALEQ